ncbi:MAG: zinc ribbon domain-containing protein [Chloroflexi bacterium]|nr:zinc ribbon domain-containing protein [Chloroflexota bacterium]
MEGQGRIVGLLLVIFALVIILIGGLFLASGLKEGGLRVSGFLLGLAVVLILALPLLGGGVFVLIRGRSEARQFAQAAQEKKILNIVRTQGQVNISDLVLEMNLTRERVKGYIYDLVGKGLFTGYINWDDGVLYAREAAEMQTTKCPNCGGIREVVGKGIVKCPYCGSELFL